MNTLCSESFAKVCKELSIYFLDTVAPDPRKMKRTNEDGYEYEEEYIATYDSLKKESSTGKAPQPPHDLQYLRQTYMDFDEEINQNTKISDFGFVSKLVRHLLNDCLPYEKMLPVEEQFFRERMFDEAELLYNFKAIAREVSQKFGNISLYREPFPF